MKITPIEIKQHSFKTKMRGYCQDEVHAFLEVVSEEFGKQKNEIKQLSQKIKKLENVLEEASQDSGELKSLAVSINSLKEDLLKNAEKEASLIIGEAKVKATRMIQASERKICTLEAEIQVLENRRQTVKENVSSFLQSQLNSLVSLNNSFEAGKKTPQVEEEDVAAEETRLEDLSVEDTAGEAELVLPEKEGEEHVLAEITVEPLANEK